MSGYTASGQATILYEEFDNYAFQISATSAYVQFYAIQLPPPIVIKQTQNTA